MSGDVAFYMIYSQYLIGCPRCYKNTLIGAPPPARSKQEVSIAFIQEELEDMKVKVCKKATDRYFLVA